MQQEQKLSSACISTDGSQYASYVIDLAVALKKLGALRNLVICHVYNLRKTYLPYEFRYDAIKSNFDKTFQNEGRVIRDFKQLEQGKTVHQQILASYHIRKCDILFLGFYGIKGQKRKADELSSKIRKFVFQSKLTLAIVKKQYQHRQKPLIAYCYDGSDIAYEGILNLLDFVASLKAKLLIVHAASRDQTKFTNIIKHQIRELKNNSRSTQIQLKILSDHDLAPGIALIDYLNSISKQLDFIAVTKNGMRGSITNKIFVGEIAYNILVQTETNLILLK